MQTESRSTLPPAQRHFFWRALYSLAVIATITISVIFQLGNFGWYKVILGIFIFLAGTIHAGYWLFTFYRMKALARPEHLFFLVNNTSFLVANIFNVDFDDVTSYMFFMQYDNPPDYLIATGYIGWAVWFVSLAVHVALRIARRIRRGRGTGQVAPASLPGEEAQASGTPLP